MSRLRAARLGPIVGHVTHETARIWIRGDDSENAGSASARNRRTLGVVTIRGSGEGHESDEDGTWYFRLHREYDRTGTFTFGRSRILGSDRRCRPAYFTDLQRRVPLMRDKLIEIHAGAT